jgi:hypothetical protein
MSSTTTSGSNASQHIAQRIKLMSQRVMKELEERIASGTGDHSPFRFHVSIPRGTGDRLQMGVHMDYITLERDDKDKQWIAHFGVVLDFTRVPVRYSTTKAVDVETALTLAVQKFKSLDLKFCTDCSKVGDWKDELVCSSCIIGSLIKPRVIKRKLDPNLYGRPRPGTLYYNCYNKESTDDTE